uniref:Uncharacterized protein n=1 Tax=Picea glauca TaxID=3330 RepID=A0A101LZH4_PICGL|nr:hypothetical protein ABT39_MTgene5241 [Picea glauca]QHR89174.1 hypothetical protein Q903MT_gene3194 [Picea sitchensis]
MEIYHRINHRLLIRSLAKSLAITNRITTALTNDKHQHASFITIILQSIYDSERSRCSNLRDYCHHSNHKNSGIMHRNITSHVLSSSESTFLSAADTKGTTGHLRNNRGEWT